MLFRRATATDVGEIAAMEAEYFSDSWSERDILATLSTELAMCFAAVDDSGLVGYILGRKIIPEGEIYRVAVKAEKRRRGIGARLLAYAIKSEAPEGVETVFLEVREANVAARGLYSSEGFTEISIRKNYYKNPTDNAVIMLLNINNTLQN